MLFFLTFFTFVFCKMNREAHHDQFTDEDEDVMWSTCLFGVGAVVVLIVGSLAYKQISDNWQMIKMVLLLNIPLLLLYLYDQGINCQRNKKNDGYLR